MKKTIFAGFLLLSSVPFASAAHFGAYAFPQNGQSPQQQTQDESFCGQWASNQTGLNPAVLQYRQQEAMESQRAAYAQANKPTPVRKLGRAALTGTAVGAMHGNMDAGAGRGAAVTTTVAASRGLGQMAEKKKQARLDQSSAAVDSVEAETSQYLRAYGACMEGKGYSIR